ncbi:MAG: Gfo/Idh/MocA family oxidoreductase [Lachnospiraceae bacterium]|jgi:predicted dehydrogenase|nr:Gfo/Idh/MocA family oxidoreductase [Lachnospiraceae bacterium]
MKFLVIGLGSMGKRRIRLLKQYIEDHKDGLREEWNIAGVDSSPDRRQEAALQLHLSTYQSMEEALQAEKFDCAVIASPPLSHAGIITNCLKNHLHVFTELNLVEDGYEKNLCLAKQQGRVLFLSSTFLYRKEMEFIKGQVRQQGFRGGYHYHIGQYLPQWHPWERYQDFFVGQKKTNACREIFAVELPWLVDVFGGIKALHVFHKKASKLEIAYDDLYQILVEHDSGILGSLTVDVISPEAKRELEVWGEEFCIRWKGSPKTLYQYDKEKKEFEEVSLYERVEHRKEYSQFVVENAYYEELVNFIGTVEGKEAPRWSFEQDREILSWIDRIEA